MSFLSLIFSSLICAQAQFSSNLFYLRLSELLIFILFYFWPHHMACRILVPQPGIEPLPPAVEVWSLNHWTTREVLSELFDFVNFCLSLLQEHYFLFIISFFLGNIYLFVCLFVCLFGCSVSQLRHAGSFSCSMRTSQLWHANSQLLHACEIQFRNQGSNLGPPHWECGVLPTGPPGKSPVHSFLKIFCIILSLLSF